MKKKLLRPLLLFGISGFTSFFGVAQNCVNYTANNGDMENISNCPTNRGQIGNVNQWSAGAFPGPGGAGFSAEHFSTSGNCTDPDYDATNSMGEQTPFNGSNYGGMVLRSIGQNNSNYHERLEYELDAPLPPGSYLIQMQVSLSEKSELAFDEFGATFSSTPQIFPATTGPMVALTMSDVTCQNTCLDSRDWMQITGTYISTAGGEQYIQIGQPALLSAQCSSSVPIAPGYTAFINPAAYYYFDDLSVTHVDFDLDYEVCNGQIGVSTNCTSVPLFYEWVYTINGQPVTSQTLSCNDCATTTVSQNIGGPINVTLNVYTDPNHCHLLYTESVILQEPNARWHQTSEDAVSSLTAHADKGNDVHVDGNLVYNTGYFHERTRITDLFGNGALLTNTNPETSAFVSCYSDCGKLQWVIYDDQVSYSEGMGVTTNDDYLFVTVNYEERIHMQLLDEGGQVTGISSPTITNGSMVVFAFDKVTGDYINHFNWVNTNRFKSSAIDSYMNQQQESSVLVCGAGQTTPSNRVFARQLNFDGISFSADWMKVGGCSRIAKANDIQYDSFWNSVWVTGQFEDFFSFPGTATVNTQGINDAYVAFFNTSGVPGSLQRFGASHLAEGTDVVASGAGHIYVLGHFDESGGNGVASPFGWNGAPTVPHVGTEYNGFIVGLGNNGNFFSQNVYVNNSGSDCFITGGDANGNELLVYGNYGRGQVVPFVGANMPVNNTTGDRVFTSSWDHVNWTPNYANTTVANFSIDNHISTRISVDNNMAYLSGEYTRRMDYHYAQPNPPFSMDLLSNPVNLYNAFILRSDLTNLGSYRNQEEVEELIVEEVDQHRIYPNPFDDNLILEINEDQFEGATYQIVDLIGNVISEGKFSSNKEQVDLRNCHAGVYFVVLTSRNNETKTIEVIKR